jgi:hypothetical protein
MVIGADEHTSVRAPATKRSNPAIWWGLIVLALGMADVEPVTGQCLFAGSLRSPSGGAERTK